MLDVEAVKCTNCNQIIYSRAQHDFHCCKCGNTCIDGGFTYTRVEGDRWTPYPLQIDATKRQLYSDWNLGKDKFGWIDDY